jgi:cytosine/uracil/thiamine/allantoin permease
LLLFLSRPSGRPYIGHDPQNRDFASFERQRTIMSATSIIRDWAVQSPAVIVYLLGIVLALIQIQRWPRVSMAAVGGLMVLVLMVLVRPIVSYLIIRGMSNSVSGSQISMAFAISGFFFNVIEAAAMGAIIYAIFAERPQVAAAGTPMRTSV